MPKFTKTALSEYRKKLNLTEPVVERVEFLFHEYDGLIGHTPDFFFLENIVGAEQQQQYTNLIFLTSNLYSEFSMDKSQNKFVCQALSSLKWVNFIHRENLNFFSAPTDNSRLTVNFVFGFNMGGQFHAHGQNCAEVLEAIRTYFIPILAAA